MNVLLIFFAIPLAVIILSAILETFIKCPVKVAGIFFSIFIVVAFALGGTAELIVLAIIYTIISFITALIVKLVSNWLCGRRNNFDYTISNDFVGNNISNNVPFNFNSSSSVNPLLEDSTSFDTTNLNSNNVNNFNNSNNSCRRCKY